MSPDNVVFVVDAYNRFNAGERKPGLWYFHEDAACGASPSTWTEPRD